ncbi:MAG: LytTR family DNA-binding domain-containing protein [Bacteroidota bacterium]|nr:LytTR family DNA-binding domain-containing protein [Bacteroidota bacterium]
MHVCIVEDEAPAAERLQDLLREVNPDIVVDAVLPSVKEAAARLRRLQPDLLFFDIRLADGSSFEIFERVDVTAPVIFTTAYDEYAIDAFKVNSIDYLLKPIRVEDLRRALDKFASLQGLRASQVQALLRSLQTAAPDYRRHFLIQVGQKLQQLAVDDIAYCYAMEKSVFCTTFDRHTHTLDFTLDALQRELDPARYFRINRKMIVSMRAIRAMHAWSRSRIRIDLDPPEPKGVEALVSVDRAADFRAWLDR